jgi:hypothetical protein
MYLNTFKDTFLGLQLVYGLQLINKYKVKTIFIFILVL